MRKQIAQLLAGLALLIASPAHATVVYVTYEGTVFGNDPTGLFGGGSINGQHFKSSYAFDVVFGLNNDDCENCPSGGGTTNYIFGGSGFSTVSPSLGATITIGNHTESVTGTFVGIISGINQGGTSGLTQQWHRASSAGNARTLQNGIDVYKGTTGLPAAILLNNYHYTVVAGDIPFGNFCTNGNASCIYLGASSLDITTQAPGASVPVPAALPLFATGVGGLGIVVWRRKRKATA